MVLSVYKSMGGEKSNNPQRSESDRSQRRDERHLDAEARLQAHHERFQRIIENTDAGYFRIGMDGSYEEVNPAWLRMYGFANREEAIGLHFSRSEERRVGKEWRNRWARNN